MVLCFYGNFEMFNLYLPDAYLHTDTVFNSSYTSYILVVPKHYPICGESFTVLFLFDLTCIARLPFFRMWW